MTLTEFLLARIAEDEAAARLGAGEPAYPHYGDTAAEECVAMAKSEGCAQDGYRHLRRHLPARVLAECEAKRKQIAHLIDFMEGDYAPWNEDQLKMMAEVYADHEDFDESWRP